MTDNNPTNPIAQQIAEQLGETNIWACQEIAHTVRVCGVEFAQALLHKTLEIEAGEGLMIKEGSRRRTPGGVFLYLVREQTDKAQRKAIFIRRRKRRLKKQPETAGLPGD